MMTSSLLASVAVCLLALVQSASADVKNYRSGLKRGYGTAYSDKGQKDKTGFNSCQFGKLSERWETYYAAIPSHMYDKESHCGLCIRVRGTEKGAPGQWVKLMIVDECASCKGDFDVDMSIPGLEASTGFEWDRKLIEWDFTSCDGSVTQDDDDDEEGSGGKRPRKDDDEDDEDDEDNDDEDEEDEDEDEDEDDNDDDDDKRRRLLQQHRRMLLG